MRHWYCREVRPHSSLIQPAGPSIATTLVAISFRPSFLAWGSIVTRHRFSFAGPLLAGLMLAGTANVFAMPSLIHDDRAITLGPVAGLKKFSQAQPSAGPGPQTPAAPAADATTDAQAPGDEPIGNVVTLTGS